MYFNHIFFIKKRKLYLRGYLYTWRGGYVGKDEYDYYYVWNGKKGGKKER
jgi:hypothetical protein